MSKDKKVNMKSKTIIKILITVILVVSSHLQADAQTLPPKIRVSLNRNYVGWKLHSGDPICKSRAIVSGDFDGNKKTDYAVMFKKGRSGYILAFLANDNSYKSVVLESSSATDMKNSFLKIARKGQNYAEIINDDLDRGPSQKLKTDAIVSGGCESSEYLYIYSNGKFKQVFTSD